MRTIRIFQQGDYLPGQIIALSDAAAHHVISVLRLKVGDAITLFRGDNFEFTAHIAQIQKKQTTIEITSKTAINRESSRKIHLAQAIAKGDKMEWVIQKAVELGVTSITPLLSERSVVRLDIERLQKKHLQWQAIAIAAAEQSGRTHIPLIHTSTSIHAFVETCRAEHQWILSPTATQCLPEMILPNAKIALLIGPEGGFTEQELLVAASHQTHAIKLGPRILRTETAAIAALAILQMKYGDLLN